MLLSVAELSTASPRIEFAGSQPPYLLLLLPLLLLLRRSLGLDMRTTISAHSRRHSNEDNKLGLVRRQIRDSVLPTATTSDDTAAVAAQSADYTRSRAKNCRSNDLFRHRQASLQHSRMRRQELPCSEP